MVSSILQDLLPTQDSSHRDDYYMFVGNPEPNLHLPLASWVGGRYKLHDSIARSIVIPEESFEQNTVYEIRVETWQKPERMYGDIGIFKEKRIQNKHNKKRTPGPPLISKMHVLIPQG